MKYLFIDTSSSNLSIAILNDNNILAKHSSFSKLDHSKNAVNELDEAFKESGLEPCNIDKLLIVNGPGSFTGVRIGVTIAKVFGWSLNKPIIPISSLKGQALSIEDEADYYVSVIDARRECVYAGIYDKDYQNVIKECYMEINKLNQLINNLDGKVIITGDIDINSNNKTIPVSLDIAKIINYYKDNDSLSAHEFRPNYLKRVEAEEKLMG